jgi:phosphoenolpyruvate carboxykinase (GTP)
MVSARLLRALLCMNQLSTQGAPAHPALREWIEQCVRLCEPEHVFYCDGSESERDALRAAACREGSLIALDQQKLPGCYYHRSNPNDVARVEQLTFICSATAEAAGPTNHWREPSAMREELRRMLTGAMRGRTLYVVPYLMAPDGAGLARVGVELTDSIYVVLNMGLMTRMGAIALEHLGLGGEFNRGLHSTLDCDPARRFICHFPEANEIISVGSGYGGNALLGKKCFSLRLGSYLGRQQGWMAEHMLLLAAESPAGEKHYIAAAFPSACGKTNFAMLIPPARFAGWKIRTIGDDIAWMQPGDDGRLWAVNPERGYFGVIPGTNSRTNPNAMRTMARDTIFTNVALTEDGGVWWEGKDGPVPARCIDWQGNAWTPESGTPAAHPNSRFTSPMANNPVLAPEADDPRGVPISAMIFGGRRRDTVPLVCQSFDWTQGVFLGASMASETTAAAAGAVGQVRRDPMAMLPFCGYHMGDYFQHWLDMGQRLSRPPLIFGVNWFRRDAGGNLLWPGFGENIRVLSWIIARCEGQVPAQESPIGWLPRREDFDLAGLADFSEERLEQLLAVHRPDWQAELGAQQDFFQLLGSRLPAELAAQCDRLQARLAAAALATMANPG